MHNDTTDTLLELDEVAKRLKISRWALNRLIRAGELEVIVLSPHVRRVRTGALKSYLAARAVAPVSPQESAP